MAATSQQIVSDADAHRASLLRNGYAVVKNLLLSDEVERLRETAIEALGELEGLGLTSTDRGSEGTIRASTCDLLSVPSLRHVLLDARLLGVIERLLGGRPCYFGDSSVRAGKSGARAWHRDNVDRVRWRGGPDWRDPYPLLRCGLYLQDQAHHSGGLALRPGSNRPGRRVPTLPRLVRAGAGDLVAWDLRIVHAGEVVRPRGLPWLALNPRLQTCLPEIMRVPDDRERIVMFMTFGLAGSHLDHYVAYLKTRDYMNKSWINSRFGEEVWEEAENAGLDVLHPTQEYGTSADSTSR
jgi:Phytanoyl-CoA dioxygenase (PhyH)